MSAFSRTHDDATWTTGNYVTVINDWKDLSSKVYRAMNGDRGGAWAPSSKIQFTAGNFEVTTHVLVAYGGSLKAAAGGDGLAGFYINGSKEWPLYADGHAFQKRTLITLMLSAVSETPELWLMDGVNIASIAISIQDRNRDVIRPAPLMLPLRVHDGATLNTATFSFRVLSPRTKAPIALPRFRIVRMDHIGNVTPLASTALGADADGWISPPKSSKTSGSAWYADGASQTLAYACDQNNVIDVETYAYWAEIDEETGTSQAVARYDIDGVVVRERKTDVDLATIGDTTLFDIADAIDGVTPTAGQRVLVLNGVIPFSYIPYFLHGIWVTQAATDWIRASDLDAADDVTTSAFVVVKGGLFNAGRVFSMRAPYPTLIGNDPTFEPSPLLFEEAKPHGNSYSSVTCEFDQIHDMRWQ